MVYKLPVRSAFVENVSHSSRINPKSSPPFFPPLSPGDKVEDLPCSAAPECHEANQIKYEKMTDSVSASSPFDTICLTTFARWRTSIKYPNPRFHPKSIRSSSQNPSVKTIKPLILKPKPCNRSQFLVTKPLSVSHTIPYSAFGGLGLPAAGGSSLAPNLERMFATEASSAP